MEGQYDRHGMKFAYPTNWQLDETESEDEITVSVTNGDTSFWSITLLLDGLSPTEVLDTALNAFREEYGEVDEYPADDELCDHPTRCVDIEFVCLELINSACLRAFRTDRHTVFVLFQATDEEMEETRQVMQAISASLEYEFGDEMFIA